MENKAENKMATMPVQKLMLSMGIPMILSMMLVSALKELLLHSAKNMAKE